MGIAVTGRPRASSRFLRWFRLLEARHIPTRVWTGRATTPFRIQKNSYVSSRLSPPVYFYSRNTVLRETRSASIMSAARSAMTSVAARGFPVVMFGIIDPSATRRFEMP
jgi:hypothetical protein